MRREVLIQLLGLLFLVLPLAAVQWNLAGNKRRAGGIISPKTYQRWRLELYSNRDDVDQAMVDRSDIPFPVKWVESARGRLAQNSASQAWALPRVEFDVDVDDPFSEEVLAGLFGTHSVRFVTGNEAVIDGRNGTRVRLRALPFR